jgi:hypothetical protein
VTIGLKMLAESLYYHSLFYIDYKYVDIHKESSILAKNWQYLFTVYCNVRFKVSFVSLLCYGF